MSSASGVGVFGKVEAQADFLRAYAGEFSQAGLDRWFEEALLTMLTEGGHVPDGPTTFLLAPRGAPKAFIGVLAPSMDAAGRSFPLVIFAEVEPPQLDELGNLLVAAGPFLSDAGMLAVSGGKLSGPALVEQALALAGPAPVGAAESSIGARLANEPTDALLAALGGSPRTLGYALRTLGAACDQASKHGPDAGTGVITVDAPAPTAIIRQLWLELVRRKLRWRQGLPSLLWRESTDDSVGRLLLTLGPPSVYSLAFLANPRHRSPRFWPLRTDVNVALDQAQQALTVEQRRLTENPSASLGELVTAFGS